MVRGSTVLTLDYIYLVSVFLPTWYVIFAFSQVQNNTDITEVIQFIAAQIEQNCQCQYNSSFIVDYQVICTTNNYDIVLQAELLPTHNKAALEIYNIVQEWVLLNPIITINNISYQVDSKCPTEVNELGVTSCSPQQQAKADHKLVAIGTSVCLAVVGVLFIALITLLVCYIHNEKLKRKGIR